MNRRGLFLLPLVFVLAVAGCASVTRTVDRGTGAIGEMLLPVSEEVRLGNQLAAEVNKQEKVHPDKEVQAYVAKVGKRIAKASGDDRKGITYRFTVIDDPKTINAFALPGGHIYVYSGLILAAKSEAELAAVLGHEVGHVTSRHAARALGAAFGLETLSRLALGEEPGTVAQLAAAIAAQGYMSRHSRDAEREADERGLDYLIAAGYEPSAMPAFFKTLAKASGSPSSLEKFFASHPEPAERAKTLEQAIRARRAGKGKTEIVGDFAKIQQRLGKKASGSKK
ncbi:MAG TPA: M48 family metallopeptidase [Fredinandcohnia sp.]|nr:M48 family metallopeptidase [Fredinandcohnia sp.]